MSAIFDRVLTLNLVANTAIFFFDDAATSDSGLARSRDRGTRP